MDNPYLHLYKKLTHVQLLDILERKHDYDAQAVQAAKLELLIRNLTQEEIASASEELARSKAKAKSRFAFKPYSPATALPDTLDGGLMEINTDRQHSVYLIIWTILFLIQMSFRLWNHDRALHLTSVASIVQLLLTFTPIIWLILYLYNRKTGWYGLTVVFIANAFQSAYAILLIFLHPPIEPGEPQVLIAIGLMLALGAVYFVSAVHLISAGILQRFSISIRSMRITVIITGLIITWFYLPQLNA